MEIVSYWIIVSVFTFNTPTYGGNFIPSETAINLPIQHKTKDSCEKIAFGMFKSIKKEETKDDPQKLTRIYCVEQFKVVENDRSLSDRTQRNRSGSIPNS